MDPSFAPPGPMKQNRPTRSPRSKRRDIDSNGVSSTSPKGCKTRASQNTWDQKRLPRDEEPQAFLLQNLSEHRATQVTEQTNLRIGSTLRSGPSVIRSFGKRPAFTKRALSSLVVEDIDPGLKEGELRAPTRDSNSIQIQDGYRVTLYLQENFLKLQQHICKIIAKTWIKEICPKKQARFPYARKGEVTDKPAWWPSVDHCRYKEPDHLTKPERVKLLVHLLRLRPEPHQVQEWLGSGPDGEPVKPIFEWTKFLKEKTFDELSRNPDVLSEPEKRIEERKGHLKSLFKVAEMEEDFSIGGRDGTDTVTWTPNPKRLKEMNPPPKRSQRNSVVVDAPNVVDEAQVVSKTNGVRGTDVAFEANVINESDTSCEPSSSAKQKGVKRRFDHSNTNFKFHNTSFESSSGAPAKRAKAKSVHSKKGRSNRPTDKRQISEIVDEVASPVDTVINETSASSTPLFHSDGNLMFPVEVNSKAATYPATPFNSSFESMQSNWYDSGGPWYMQLSLPRGQTLGRQGMLEPPQHLEARSVYGGDQAQFQTAPSLHANPNMALNLDTNNPDPYAPQHMWCGGLPMSSALAYGRFLGEPTFSYGGFRTYDTVDNKIVLDGQRPVQGDQMYPPTMNNGNSDMYDADWIPSAAHGMSEQYTCEAPLSFAPRGTPASWPRQLNWPQQ